MARWRTYYHSLTLSQRHFPSYRHQMETFSALLPLCAGNSPVTGEFPTQRPVTRSFDVFLICSRINNGEAGGLRHQCAHYVVSVILLFLFCSPLPTRPFLLRATPALRFRTAALHRLDQRAGGMPQYVWRLLNRIHMTLDISRFNITCHNWLDISRSNIACHNRLSIYHSPI